MVVEVPLTMIGYIESGINVDYLKLRICSISLSFLLLVEILSIREQRHLRLKKLYDRVKKQSDLKPIEKISEDAGKQTVPVCEYVPPY
jgi:hypothetical protein